ncbi:MAG: hypothetical protein R3B93_07570 [Bacteroidia bacterium]
MSNQNLKEVTDWVDSPSKVDWEKIRSQFNLSKEWIHLAHMYITSHPKKVQDAIEFYRKELDENPALYVKAHRGTHNREVAKAAAAYLEALGESLNRQYNHGFRYIIPWIKTGSGR